MRIGPLTIPGTGAEKVDDPYWDGFINRAPADRANVVSMAMADLDEGTVNPTRSEVHSPNVMAGHVRDLGRFLGVDRVGIVELAKPASGDVRSFGIVCVLQSDHDTRTSLGSGGQAPTVKGLFATFNIASYIRELGYPALRSKAVDGDALAARAGLGTLDGSGRLVNQKLGARPHVAEVIVTELPLEADAVETP
jgi:hypothetical protein